MNDHGSSRVSVKGGSSLGGSFNNFISFSRKEIGPAVQIFGTHVQIVVVSSCHFLQLCVELDPMGSKGRCCSLSQPSSEDQPAQLRGQAFGKSARSLSDQEIKAPL